MTTKEQIAVMEAFGRGEAIEYRILSVNGEWETPVNIRWNWDKYEYRVKPKSEYIPFDFGDDLIGTVIVSKKTGKKYMVFAQNEEGVGCWDGLKIYEVLLRDWKFTDGSVCGKLKEEKQ